MDFRISFSGSIQRTFSNYDLGYEGPVISDYYSNSIVNDFVPYHALLSGKLLTKNSLKALVYSLDVSNSYYNTLKSYEQFFNYLAISSNWYKLGKKNTKFDYRCRAGQLVVFSYDRIIPLVTLVVNKEHIFNIDKGNPDLSKFFIVISKEFAESEEHSNVYNNFCKYYLKFVSSFISVIYTKDIRTFCYKQVPIIPVKAKTISEAKNSFKLMTFEVIRSITTRDII